MNSVSGEAPRGWREAIASFAQPRAIAMLFLGFAAGLPFLLVFSTLSAWLSEAEVSRSTIGFFSWVGITYSIKVLWAPVIDRLPIPYLTRILGRRRSWMLIAQAGIAVGLIGMAGTDPAGSLAQLALFAVLVAFASATQDVSIDAYRIEAAIPEMQGIMSAMYITGYRLGLLAAGAGAFYIAEFWSWPAVYLSMAALMLVGMVTVLVISEPVRNVSSVASAAMAEAASWWQRLAIWFYDAVLCPFLDFFRRHGHWALLILVFIGIYRISDITMGVMANPFYLELGYSKVDIANIGKVYGFFMSIGRCGSRRPAGRSIRRHASAAAGRGAGLQYQPAVRLAGDPAAAAGTAGAGHQRRQPQRRSGSVGVHCLSVESDQHSLHCDSIRAVQLADDAARQNSSADSRASWWMPPVTRSSSSTPRPLGVPAIALVIVLMYVARNRGGPQPTSSAA